MGIQRGTKPRDLKVRAQAVLCTNWDCKLCNGDFSWPSVEPSSLQVKHCLHFILWGHRHGLLLAIGARTASAEQTKLDKYSERFCGCKFKQNKCEAFFHVIPCINHLCNPIRSLLVQSLALEGLFWVRIDITDKVWEEKGIWWLIFRQCRFERTSPIKQSLLSCKNNLRENPPNT